MTPYLPTSAALAWLVLAASGASADPLFTDGFEPVGPACLHDPDPRMQPAGFEQRMYGWGGLFYGQSFPSIDAGGPSPVGSFTMEDQYNPQGWPIKGLYFSAPFVPEADQSYKLEWYRAQTVAQRGYVTVNPSSGVFVTISPCAGDFRLMRYDVPRTDERSSACRSYAQNGSLFYGTVAGGSACVLQAGVQYYLNIVFTDPVAMDPATDTCVHQFYCDANFSD